MSSARFRDAPPRAGAMLESLRGLGYSPATAMADIIDNSIAAHANTVQISFVWRGVESCIAVSDDGRGMTEAVLDRAMRLGERNPLETREPGDLGRFGLGLKTASFSQCRRLTVASQREGSFSCLHWDLDVLANIPDGRWRLMEGPGAGASEFIGSLANRSSGTVIVWNALDRIITPGSTEQDFLDLIDRVERHLSMVFHRYLSGPAPTLTIEINGRAIAPWDPFLTANMATWRSPLERIPSEAGIIEVQCFVLPHRDRLTSREYEEAAGPDGWTAQQGFYVYRNRRLLVAGNWLGLGSGRPWTKEETHRLARVRLDIPNTADVAWNIDVRKSTARPPAVLRERLTRLAEDCRARARRVFVHRGQQASSSAGPVISAWKAVRTADSLQYRIDQDHPAVQMVLEVAGPLREEIQAMLRVIEETVPVQRIWLDTAESKEVARNSFSLASLEEITAVVNTLYRSLVLRKGMAPGLARARLLATEPFNQYPEIVSSLPDEAGKTE
jgi:hypothetical protein